MNEFYTPDRGERKTETAFDEPANDLNIVVDDSDGGAVFCRKCGCRLDPSDIFCSKCGARTDGETQTQSAYNTQTASAQTESVPHVQNVYNYNYNYGTNVNGDYIHMEPGMKNKWVSVALCLLLGVVGGHRFYEGKIPSAFLYLFTGGLCGIGVIIDLIILLGKPKYYKP